MPQHQFCPQTISVKKDKGRTLTAHAAHNTAKLANPQVNKLRKPRVANAHIRVTRDAPEPRKAGLNSAAPSAEKCRSMLNIGDVFNGLYVKGIYARCFCDMATVCHANPQAFQIAICTLCNKKYSDLEKEYEAKIPADTAKELAEVAKAKKKKDEDEDSDDADDSTEDFVFQAGTDSTVIKLFEEKIEPFYNITQDKHKTDYENAEARLGDFKNGDVAKNVSDKYKALPPRSVERSNLLKPIKEAIENGSVDEFIDALDEIIVS